MRNAPLGTRERVPQRIVVDGIQLLLDVEIALNDGLEANDDDEIDDNGPIQEEDYDTIMDSVY